jgi:hypothetical protein
MTAMTLYQAAATTLPAGARSAQEAIRVPVAAHSTGAAVAEQSDRVAADAA